LGYVRAHVAYLEPLLLLELVHEGAPASWMRRVASLGGLERRFEAWAERLAANARAQVAPIAAGRATRRRERAVSPPSLSRPSRAWRARASPSRSPPAIAARS